MNDFIKKNELEDDTYQDCLIWEKNNNAKDRVPKTQCNHLPSFNGVSWTRMIVMWVIVAHLSM
jgi:hypothetical protein